jgi:sulfatase maturation enzyme AslB (radical SAM superfamily)
MQDTAGSIRTLYITGGEPTVIKQNIEFLEYLVAQKHSGQIRITINTNATNINKELLAVLNNFLSVGFVISVDGIDDIAYIQRTPSRWNQIEKNIDAIVEWFGQRYNPRDWICFNSVVTCLNFHHMPAMWSYLLDRYSRSRAPIGFGFIPIIPADVNFGVEAVPAPARDQISQEFDNFKAKAQTHKANTTNVIESFEYWLNNINYAADYAPIQFTLDKVQGLHPELNVAEIYRIFYPDVL